MKKSKEKTEEIPFWTELRQMLQEVVNSQKEIAQMIKNLSKDVGGIANSNGEFAEEYFENAFKLEPFFAGQQFDVMQKNLCVADPGIKRRDEFDIVLYNKSSIAIIEIKYKARESNVDDVIRKAEAFRFWFPRYKNYKIYLGLACLILDEKVIHKAESKGVSLIRQYGGKTISNDKNLKVY
jgi:hypothetical protein